MRIFLNIISVLSIVGGLLLLLGDSSEVLAGGFLFGFGMLTAAILAASKKQ